MPLADGYAVLAKLSTALLVIPVAGFLGADAVTLGVALTIQFRPSSSLLGALLWSPDQWLQLQVLWSYLIVACALWFLPLAGWLLFVSSWARKSPALWATLPILVPYLIERWLLHTRLLESLVIDRFTNFPSLAFRNDIDEAFSISNVVDKGIGSLSRGQSVWEIINVYGLLTHQGTWIGLALGTVLIIATVQVRRRHANA